MTEISVEKLRQVGKAARLLKTMSNEHRLLILCLLIEKPMNVSELYKVLQIPQTTVSQHLSRLRLDGLVTFERTGKVVTYSLNSEFTQNLIQLLKSEYCP